MANDSEKTSRIAYLCITMVVLGALLFLSKANACALACQSCSQSSTAPCRDEFYELRTDERGGVADYTCTPGAKAEVVVSPPAPKPGILCHCPAKDEAQNVPQPAQTK